MKFKKKKMKRRIGNRQRNTVRYQMSKEDIIDYKNIDLLQKFLNDRGKITPRRITGVSAAEQRQITISVKRARFLALLNLRQRGA